MGYLAQASGVIGVVFFIHDIYSNPMHVFFGVEEVLVYVGLGDDTTSFHDVICILYLNERTIKIQPPWGEGLSKLRRQVRGSAVTSAMVVSHCLRRNLPPSLSFRTKKDNISVDADLLGETSCLHGAHELFVHG